MTTPTPQDAALRAAVLDAITAEAEAESKKARKEAEAAFKAALSATGFRAATGAIQVDIPLPSGEVIGKLSVKAGSKTSSTDEVGLHEWVAERNPEALEEYAPAETALDGRLLDLLADKCPDLFESRLKAGALQDPRVLDLLQANLPDLLESRVREATRREYVKLAERVTDKAPRGWLYDPETDERLHLVTETQEPPSGAFMFNGAETTERRRRVMEALAAGDPVVRAIAFGAVGAIGPVPAETPAARPMPAGGEPGE